MMFSDKLLEARLVVEVDGATHSADGEIARDATRSATLAAQGYHILRFANDDVFHNLDGVLETIRTRLMDLRPRLEHSQLELGATPHPDPPPQGGRESLPPPSARGNCRV